MSLSEKWVNAIYKIVTGGNKSKYILTPAGGLIINFYFSIYIHIISFRQKYFFLTLYYSVSNIGVFRF